MMKTDRSWAESGNVRVKWLKMKIKEAEERVARYKVCEMTLVERCLFYNPKELEKIWQNAIDN